jgi:hypothetical protein
MGAPDVAETFSNVLPFERCDETLARFVLLRQAQLLLQPRDEEADAVEPDVDAPVGETSDVEDFEDFGDQENEFNGGGPVWSRDQLDLERATKLACERVFAAFIRSSVEHGHAPREGWLPNANEVVGRLEAGAVELARAREERRAAAELRGEDKPIETLRRTTDMGEATSRLISGLRKNGPQSLAAIAAMLGTEKVVAREVLVFLRDTGEVHVIGQKRSARWALRGQTLRDVKQEAPAPKPVPPRPDSEPPPSGGETAPVPEPIAARAPTPSADIPSSVVASLLPQPHHTVADDLELVAKMRRKLVRSTPGPRAVRKAPRAPKVSAVDAILAAVKDGTAKRRPRVAGAPLVSPPTLTTERGGLVLRWRGFVLDLRDRAHADRLLKLARAED